MKIIQLSEQFYTEYADCKEILKKTNRPYLCILVKLNNMDFAIPFRHHIKHQYCFHTLGEAGIDFTKAIPIVKQYFVADVEVKVDTAEWKIINKNENTIHYEFSKYVKQVKRALERPDKIYSQNIIKYSALQYFKTELSNNCDKKSDL